MRKGNLTLYVVGSSYKKYILRRIVRSKRFLNSFIFLRAYRRFCIGSDTRDAVADQVLREVLHSEGQVGILRQLARLRSLAVLEVHVRKPFELSGGCAVERRADRLALNQTKSSLHTSILHTNIINAKFCEDACTLFGCLLFTP